MNAKLARSILRIAAVLIMIYGGIAVTTTLIGTFGIFWMDPSARDSSTRGAIATSTLTNVCIGFAIAAWGWVLFHYSDSIAEKVCADPVPPEPKLDTPPTLRRR